MSDPLRIVLGLAAVLIALHERRRDRAGEPAAPLVVPLPAKDIGGHDASGEGHPLRAGRLEVKK